jgi:ZIP family zinc transporter
MLGHFLTREQVGRTMGLPHRPHAPQTAALPPAGGLHWRWRHLGGLATVLGALAAWAQQLPQSRWLQGRGVSGALMGGSMAARGTALGTVPVPLLSQKFAQRSQHAMPGFGAGAMLAASSFALFIPVLA